MTTVQRSALVPYPAPLMYALVADIDRYPEFLPWCSRARIDAVEGDLVQATIEISFGGIRQRFTTRNVNKPCEAISLELVEGPFRHLHGRWVFTALGGDSCKIEFAMSYEFRSELLGRLVGPVFGQIANTMVDAFVRRAAAGAKSAR
jgi:ribosome-associated toxin RatA of RatAB toxin-antitoxin module